MVDVVEQGSAPWWNAQRARAACDRHMGVGADGLIVEVHPHPEKAVSDGAQSLDLSQFAKMMRDLEPYVKLWKSSREAVAAVAV